MYGCTQCMFNMYTGSHGINHLFAVPFGNTHLLGMCKCMEFYCCQGLESWLVALLLLPLHCLGQYLDQEKEEETEESLLLVECIFSCISKIHSYLCAFQLVVIIIKSIFVLWQNKKQIKLFKKFKETKTGNKTEWEKFQVFPNYLKTQKQNQIKI